jgi:hypothetical protein
VETDATVYPPHEIDRLEGIGAMITSIANRAEIVQFLRGYTN